MVGKGAACPKRIGLLVGMLSVALGCSSNGSKRDDSPMGGASNVKDLRYADIEPIIEDKCERCHSDPPENGAPVSLDSYEDVVKMREDVLRVVVRRLMPLQDPEITPPVEDLTEEERNDLALWLQAGAPR